jgi:hypothetical protein
MAAEDSNGSKGRQAHETHGEWLIILLGDRSLPDVGRFEPDGTEGFSW